MAGIRETKKARTRREILENAVALFRRDGVRRARAAEIAEASDVSVATLFNYFPTRSDLAAGWVREEVDRVVDEALEEVGERGLRGGLRRAVRDLAHTVSDRVELRLEAWRNVPRARGDVRAGTALQRQVERDQERGRLRADLSAAAIARLVEAALEEGLIAACARAAQDGVLPGDAEREAIERDLRARVDLVLDGARKRNERVEAVRSEGGGSAAVPARSEGRGGTAAVPVSGPRSTAPSR